VFASAEQLLSNTSPPAGYITRVILPQVPAGDVPAGVFETDRNKVVRSKPEGQEVETNHFLGRSDGRQASRDSTDRAAKIHACIDDCLLTGDHKVSVAEGWALLQKVERGGAHAFGTLHALVFRAEPWVFELRIGEQQPGGLVAASSSKRRYALARDELFPAAVGSQKAAAPAGNGSERR